MAIYRYVKQEKRNDCSKKSIFAAKNNIAQKKEFKKTLLMKKRIKINFIFPKLPKKSFPKLSPRLTTSFSILFIASGMGMLFLVFWPMIKWQIMQGEFAPDKKIIKPMAVSSPQIEKDGRVFASAGEKESDLTKASNWFPVTTQKNNSMKIKEYTLSIPKLKIENAKVLVGGEDLTISLIHYGGTAIPGEYGNSVIFGHSVLPEFYDPKNYQTIFTTLTTLEIGDEIFVTVDNVKYKYIIYDFKTVDPTDVSVLEQRFDNYYMSLITCVPPGLKLKRLVVKAKLEPFDEEERKNTNESSGN